MAQKSKNRVIIIAAWIAFCGAILSAIIYAVVAIRLNSHSDGGRKVSIDISLYEQNEIPSTDSLDSKSVYQNLLKIRDDTLSDFIGKNAIKYEYSRLERNIKIVPKVDYLQRLNQNDVMSGMNREFVRTYPTLSIKMVNNTSETVYFSNVQVSIVSSEVIREPVIRVRNLTNNELVFVNDGWGKLVKPEISFSITDCSAFHYITAIEKPFKYSILLEDFDLSLKVDLSKFRTSPAEVSSSFDWTYTYGWRIPFFAPDFLPLKTDTVCVFGVLDYMNEESEPRSFKFKTLVELTLFAISHLGNRIDYSSIYGLNLEAGNFGYKKNLSISHALKPKGTDHFLLLLVSDKSAKYHMRFKFLSLNNLEVMGNDVFIEFFIPRTGRRSKIIEDTRTLELVK